MRKPNSANSDLPSPPRELWDLPSYGAPQVGAAAETHVDVSEGTPTCVQIGILLQCTATVVQGLDVVVAKSLLPFGGLWSRVGVFAAVSTVLAVLLYKIATGRRWARQTLLHLVVVAGLLATPVVISTVRATGAHALALFGLWMLHAAGAAFLYGPGTDSWFGKPTRSTATGYQEPPERSDDEHLG